VTDFVHENCSTKWKIYKGDRKEVFKHELLAQGKSFWQGMLTEPPDNPKRNDTAIDKEELGDCYFEI